MPARLGEVQAVHDPDTLARCFEEIALTGHQIVIRAIGRVVAEKLRALESGGAAVARGAAALVASTIRQRFAAWERANPSHLDQVSWFQRS